MNVGWRVRFVAETFVPFFMKSGAKKCRGMGERFLRNGVENCRGIWYNIRCSTAEEVLQR